MPSTPSVATRIVQRMTFGQVETWSKIMANSTGATNSRMTVRKFAGVAIADGP